MRNKFISGGLIFLFVVLSTRIPAQSVGPTDKIKIIPPAPDVAAFQRFGNVPISPYTGVPNIAVPVYTVKMGDIDIPVSINYHASGIKVTDEASRVGLGWALNAGGVITRSVMNMDDFASRDDAYHFNTSVPDLNDGPRGDPGTAVNIQGAGLTGLSGCTVATGSTDVSTYLKSGQDYQPDLYSFNFSGYSGTFILKRDKQAVLMKNEKIKITWLPTNGGSWEIKTPDGTTYLFEEHEDYIDYFSGYSGGAPSINSWFLTKIISSKGNVAEFVYQKFADRIKVYGSFFETLVPIESITFGPAPCLPTDPLVYYYYNLPNKEYSKIYLDKINFDNGSLSFFYSGRDDIEQDVKLDSIRLAQESGTVIKRWQFGYEYFEGAMDEDQNNGTLALRTKRLKLKTFEEKGMSNESTNPYVFTYNNEGTFANAPQKTSFARDHWGYFNGRYSNTHLAPTTIENHAQSMAARQIGVFDNTRDVDPAFNQLFILKEITYPTKGRTTFEYESNDFDILQSNTKDHSFFANYPEVIEKQIMKNYDGHVHTEQPASAQTADYILDLTDLYIDPLLQNPTSAVNLTAFFRYGSNPNPCLASGVIAQLCKEDGTVLSTADVAFFIGQTSMPMTTCVPGPGGNYIGAEFKNLYNLTAGKYIWKLTIGSGIDYIEDAHLKITYYANKTKQDITNNGIVITGADFGGGLRIKRVLDYDNINPAPVNVKRYQYNYTDAFGKIRSFGKRMARPVYAYFDEKFYTQHCTEHIVQDFHTWTREIQSESLVPVENSVSGACIGYDQVIEYDGENGEYGKTVYQFENEPNTILDYSSFDYLLGSWERIPRKPASFCTVPNYGNGNIITETAYKNINGDFFKVKEISNSYIDFYPGNTSVVYGVERRLLSGTIPNPFCQFDAFVYPAIARTRKLLTSSTTKIYDQNGEIPALAQTTNYEYNNSTHLQLTSVSTTDSKGRLKTTSYKYPLDYDDSQDDNAIDLMKNSLFMHDKPVVTENSITEAGIKKITGLDITKYAFNTTANTVLPAEEASLDLTAPVLASSVSTYVPATNSYPAGVTPKVDFLNYNTKGNITQLNKVNDINFAYIWDYKNNLPVASVTNASADQVAYASFETTDFGGWTISGSLAVVSQTSDITGNSITGKYALAKTAMSGGNITKTGLPTGNYIVSYWLRSGTAGGSLVVNGATAVKTFATNSWEYYQHELTNVNSITVSFPATPLSWPTIDELRLYPKDAQMTTYTYEPLIGMTGTCNASSRVTAYGYDGLSRLKLVRGQADIVLKSFEYHYKQ